MSSIILLFTLFLTTTLSYNLYSVENLKHTGKLFRIAIPPNGAQNDVIETNAIEIHVTSEFTGKVTLKLPNNTTISKDVSPNNATIFSTLYNQEIDHNIELYEFGVVRNKSLELSSDVDISLYVLNSKSNSSDSYMAIPISSWGKEYIHCSFYDFPTGTRRSAGGFAVIAEQDGTELKINYFGKGNNVTKNGNRIGDAKVVTLNKGEVFNDYGPGLNVGEYDLTGTTILANKNIGFISYHQRTLIPSFSPDNGRDLLCEMLPPIKHWGYKYYSLDYKRREQLGDFFRIVAPFDNTIVSIKSYDKSGNLIDTKIAEIDNAPDFWEYNNSIIAGNNKDKLTGIRGFTVWESDKPFLLMQYAYSASWDFELYADPLMSLVIPADQFINKCRFLVPNIKTARLPRDQVFVSNYLNIIVKFQDKSRLDEVLVDGIPLNVLDNSIEDRLIPNEEVYFTTIPLAEGFHTISSPFQFGAYLYGFGREDSYGMPLGANYTTAYGDIIYNLEYQCGSFIINLKAPTLDFASSANIVLTDNILEAELTSNDFEIVGHGQKVVFTPTVAISQLKIIPKSKFGDKSTTLKVLTELGKTLEIPIEYYEEGTFRLDARINNIGNVVDAPGSLSYFELCTGNLRDTSSLSKIVYKISYETKFFVFKQISLINNIDLNWSIDTRFENNLNLTEIYFTFIANAPVNQDRCLAILELQSLLNDNTELSIKAEIISTNYEDCLNTDSDTSQVDLVNCLSDRRYVEASTQTYYLQQVVDNIQLEVNYGIGLEGQTNLYLSDINGNIFYQENEIKQIGQYSSIFSLSELSSGVYFLVLESGPYKHQEKINIQK